MNNIKQLRKQKGWSVTELALSLNMSQSNLTKIENGQVELKTDVAEKIAALLDVSPSALTMRQPVEGVVWLDVLNPQMLSLPPLSRLPVPAHMLQSAFDEAALFVLPDDTMTPTVAAGSLVLIDKSKKFAFDGLYLLQINENFILRRLQKTLNGKLNLLCDNPHYPAQQTDFSSLNIVGKAVLTWHGIML